MSLVNITILKLTNPDVNLKRMHQLYIAFFCLKIFFYLYSVDPDEMQHFHLGLHCLQKYSLRGFKDTEG